MRKSRAILGAFMIAALALAALTPMQTSAQTGPQPKSASLTAVASTPAGCDATKCLKATLTAGEAVQVQVGINTAATIRLESSADCTTYVTIATYTNPATAQQYQGVPVGACFEIRVTAISSGSVAVNFVPIPGGAVPNVTVLTQLPTGSNTIGAVTFPSAQPITVASAAPIQPITFASPQPVTFPAAQHIIADTIPGLVCALNQPASVAIDASSAATAQIVAASGSTVITICGLYGIADATDVVTVKSGDTGGSCANPVAKSGAFHLAAAGVINLVREFQLPSGKAFCLTTSTTANFNGIATYVQI